MINCALRFADEKSTIVKVLLVLVCFFGVGLLLMHKELGELGRMPENIPSLRIYHKSVAIFQTIADYGSFSWESFCDPSRSRYINVTEQQTMFSEPDMELYIYRAYRDDRKQSSTIIRIFGIEKKNCLKGKFTCRWISQDGAELEVPAIKYYLYTSWPSWGDYAAVRFHCELPRESRPKTVHFISWHYNGDFELVVEETLVTEPKKDLAVCVKPVTGNYDVARIVEWVEMQRLAGIEHFIVYDTDMHGPARFVLNYYSDRGIATVIPFPYLTAILKQIEPPKMSDADRYAVYQQVYLVAYHDCLYRFHGSFTFLEIIDLDEVILPVLDEPFPQTIIRLQKEHPSAASFLFSTAWHFEESGMAFPNDSNTPHYLYMQQYARANSPAAIQPKSVLSTGRTVTLNYHGAIQLLDRRHNIVLVPWKDYGYVHHYRGTCKGKFQPDRCRGMMVNATVDAVVIRYKDGLRNKVRKELEHLQLTKL